MCSVRIYVNLNTQIKLGPFFFPIPTTDPKNIQFFLGKLRRNKILLELLLPSHLDNIHFLFFISGNITSEVGNILLVTPIREYTSHYLSVIHQSPKYLTSLLNPFSLTKKNHGALDRR